MTSSMATVTDFVVLPSSTARLIGMSNGQVTYPIPNPNPNLNPNLNPNPNPIPTNFTAISLQVFRIGHLQIGEL